MNYLVLEARLEFIPNRIRQTVRNNDYTWLEYEVDNTERIKEDIFKLINLANVILSEDIINDMMKIHFSLDHSINNLKFFKDEETRTMTPNELIDVEIMVII